MDIDYTAGHAFLRDCVPALSGHGVGIHIHYWGLGICHYSNLVHKHSFFEACYVLDGVGEYTDSGTDFPLEAGTLFLSRPDAVHQIRSQSGLLIWFVAFELIPEVSSEQAKDWFSELSGTSTFWIGDGQGSPTARLWRALMKQASQSPEKLADAVAASGLGLILSFLNTFAEPSLQPKKSSLGASTSGLMRRTKLFIRDNVGEALGLEEMAGYLNVSPRHLSRLFKQETGIPYSDYVRMERVKQAASALRTSDWTIKRIAEATGFVSVHYFTRVFKAETGFTPGEYRKLRGTIFTV